MCIRDRVKAVLQITAVNFFLYLAVLPIIVLTSRTANGFSAGVILAFVYGYGGMFAAGNMTCLLYTSMVF